MLFMREGRRGKKELVASARQITGLCQQIIIIPQYGSQMKRCSIYVTKVKWIGTLVSMVREDCERVNTWMEIV